MRPSDVYVDLDGNSIVLSGLDVEERRLLARLRRRAMTHRDWCAFRNYWTQAVAEFYDARGLSRKKSAQTAVFRIAQDLSSRLGIAAGLIRPTDYRDQLKEIVLEQFPSRRAFCKAAGISEDLLSHVLAGRKDLSLATLSHALERIGYSLRIAPALPQKRTG